MEYVDVPYYDTSNTVTAQLQLFEGTNRIEIHSSDVPSDGFATQGIENANGTEGLATPERNSQTWSTSNDYVAFYYEPGNSANNCGLITSIDMSQSLFTCSDLGANVVTVTVTDTDGNSANCTSTVTITDPLVVCVLGIEDNELESSVRIFPNPTSGQVTLFNDSNMDIDNITILDINGRIIKQITMDSTTTNINFSLVSLAQGMYFVKIENETTSIVKRILKQ